MKLRESLKPWVQWKLGNKQQCLAFAQPWFQGALDCIPIGEEQRCLWTCDLVETQTGNWNIDSLIQNFGYMKCMEIFANVDPLIPGAEGDRLVFKRASNGIYSVKAGYNSLKGMGSSVSTGNKELWSSIWHRGDVLPRIRVIFWKLLHRALPLAKIMHRQFPDQSPICVICGCQEEDVSHLLHLCPFSRAFLAGSLGLRTDEFQGEFADVLQLAIHFGKA